MLRLWMHGLHSLSPGTRSLTATVALLTESAMASRRAPRRSACPSPLVSTSTLWRVKANAARPSMVTGPAGTGDKRPGEVALAADHARGTLVTQNDADPLPGFPQVGIGRQPLVIFHRAHRLKVASGARHRRGMNRAGGDGHLPATLTQSLSQGQKGKHIPGAADAEQERAQGYSLFVDPETSGPWRAHAPMKKGGSG